MSDIMDEMVKELDQQPWYTKALISVGVLGAIYLLERYQSGDKEDEISEHN